MEEKNDYTKWQQQKFDNVSFDDFNAAAAAYAEETPFQMKIVQKDHKNPLE